MKVLKGVLLTVALLALLIVAGCQEGYTSQNYPSGGYAWERSATGWWQPDVAHPYGSDREFELSRR